MMWLQLLIDVGGDVTIVAACAFDQVIKLTVGSLAASSVTWLKVCGSSAAFLLETMDRMLHSQDRPSDPTIRSSDRVRYQCKSFQPFTAKLDHAGVLIDIL